MYEPNLWFCKAKKGGWVAKQGRTSPHTSGEVNKLCTTIKWHEEFVTEEKEVFGLNRNFADTGDSGSWVTDEDLELVGMVIANDPYATKWSIGFVSDIGEIEEDVKELCGVSFALP